MDIVLLSISSNIESEEINNTRPREERVKSEGKSVVLAITSGFIFKSAKGV